MWNPKPPQGRPTRSESGAAGLAPLDVLATVAESSDEAFIGKSLDGTIRSWNPAAERMYGYTAAEVVGQSISILAPPDRGQEMLALLRRVAAGERVQHLETTRITRSGREIAVMLNVSPVRDQTGRVIGGAAIAHDLTSQQEAAGTIARQSEILAVVFETSPDGILVVDSRGRFAFVNTGAERMFGYAPGELTGSPLEELVPETQRAAHAHQRTEYGRDPHIRRTSAHLRIRGRRKDGTDFPADIALAPLEGLDQPMTLAVVRDVSEHERLELSRREAEARYRSLVEQVPAIVYTNSQDFETCLYVSPQFEKILGFDPERWLKDPGFFDRLVHPEDRSSVSAAERKALASTGVPFEAEYRTIARDGREIWFQDRATLVRGADGDPPYWQGIMLDITEQKVAQGALQRAGEELRRSEERLRSLTENISDAIVVVGPDGTPSFESAGVERLMGYGLGEVVAPFASVHEEDRASAVQLFERLLLHPGETAQAELRVLHADGTWRWADVVAKNLLEDPAIGGVLVNFRDVTARKEAEADLRLSVAEVRALSEERNRLLVQLISAEERERARIASDIHDDTIQQVTALLMRLELLASRHADLRTDEHFAHATEVAQAAIRSLRYLTFELRPHLLDREGVGPAMASHLHELQRMSPVPRYVLHNLLSEEPPIETRVVLYRVAHEALVNARRHSRASRVDVTLEWRDGMCCLEVRDDGIGFAPGRGDSPAGHMGLSTIRDRAKVAGGWYRLESAAGRGTSVAVGIPVIQNTQTGR